MDLDYPGAGHAFLLSNAPPGAPPTATVPRYGGTYGADAQASADAAPKLRAFLAAL